MFKIEVLSILFKGNFPLIISGLLWAPFFALSLQQEEHKEFHKKFAIPSALAGFLFSHPFFVIATKV